MNFKVAILLNKYTKDRLARELLSSKLIMLFILAECASKMLFVRSIDKDVRVVRYTYTLNHDLMNHSRLYEASPNLHIFSKLTLLCVSLCDAVFHNFVSAFIIFVLHGYRFNYNVCQLIVSFEQNVQIRTYIEQLITSEYQFFMH